MGWHVIEDVLSNDWQSEHWVEGFVSGWESGCFECKQQK